MTTAMLEPPVIVLEGVYCTLTDQHGKKPARYRVRHLKDRQYSFWKIEREGDQAGKTMHIADLATMRCMCRYKQFRKSDGKYCRHLLFAQELETEMKTDVPDAYPYPEQETAEMNDATPEPATMVVSKPQEAAIAAPEKPPTHLIELAISKGLTSPEYLDKIMAYLREEQQRISESQFTLALATAQGELSPIVKRGSNQGKAYPKLEDVQEEVTPVFSKNGLAFSFYEGEAKKESDMRVCCLIRHIGGYKHEYFLDLPMDGVGAKGNANKTPIHAKVSAASYGQRKLLLMISNLQAVNEDKDGGPIQEEQTKAPAMSAEEKQEQTDEVNAIHELVHELRFVDRLFEDGLKQNYGVKSVWDLTRDQRKECWDRLQTYKAKSPPKKEGENGSKKSSTPVNATDAKATPSGVSAGAEGASTKIPASSEGEQRVPKSTTPVGSSAMSNGTGTATPAGQSELDKQAWAIAVNDLYKELDAKGATYNGQMMRHGWQVCGFDKDKDPVTPTVNQMTVDQIKHLTRLVKQGGMKPQTEVAAHGS
jgi:hypothetical protein